MQLLLIAIFPILVIVAALKDAVSFTIPNWISLALLAAFPPIALLCGMGAMQLAIGLGLGLLALVAGMGMFAAGWIGGGDAKLFAACALWMGVSATGPFLAVTALAGGALAVILLAMRSTWIRPLAVKGPAWFGRLATPGASVPYGVAIAFGALTAFPQSAVMLARAVG